MKEVNYIVVISNFMEQSLWEADIRLASKEIPRLLEKPKILYHVFKSPCKMS
jgi:hypothetical protein